MSLRRLYLRHPQSTVWVVGTGPRLDALDPADLAGPVRIYLNRAAMVLPAEPHLSYWFTLDDNWGCGYPGDWFGLLTRVRSGEVPLIGVWP